MTDKTAKEIKKVVSAEWKKNGERLSETGSLYFVPLADFIAIAASFFLQYFIRFKSGFYEEAVIYENPAILMTAFAFFVAYWLTLLFFSGMYKNWYIRSPFEEVFGVFRVSLAGFAIALFAMFLDGSSFPRLMFLFSFASLTFFLIVGRFFARRIQRKLRMKGVISIPALIVGDCEKSEKLLDKMFKATAWGYSPIGVLFVSETELEKWKNSESAIAKRVPALGVVGDIDDIFNLYKPTELKNITDQGAKTFFKRLFPALSKNDSDEKRIAKIFQSMEVVIASETRDRKFLLDLTVKCAERNVKVKIVPDMYNHFTGQTRAFHLYGIPLIEISPQLLKPWEATLKRLFDIAFSLCVIVFGAPLWILIAIMIKLESPGQVFFKQERVGKNGKIFKMYKFRSMVKDAHKQKQKWTSVNDPRVTKFGRILRKSHLDEIPQFFNAFKGDMSIVGPRPEQPRFVEEFSAAIPYYKRRLTVLPGITGWWQVKYQPHELNAEEIENRLKDDFYYIENMSMRLDLEIIVRTVWSVFSGHGQA